MVEKIPEMPPAARLLMKTEILTAESNATALDVVKIMMENHLGNVFILKSGKPVF